MHCFSEAGDANPEKGDPVTQKPHRALELIGLRPAVFARQGSVVATWRSYGGRRLGPYYRLVYREEGRQRTVYLGRAGELVDRVRAALAKLQRPIRERRRLARIAGQVRVSLRREKARLGMILRRWGLYLKGFELRGGRGRLERVEKGDITDFLASSAAGRDHAGGMGGPPARRSTG